MPRHLSLFIPAAARAAIVLALAVVGMPLRAQESAPSPTQVLHPGDVIRISVWRQPELSGEFHIMADGSIAHPLYQAVDIRNVPLQQVAARVREYLTQFTTDPQVVVEPLLSVAVGGEVQSPGIYNVLTGTTLSQAIAQAGGIGADGSARKVRLTRGARQQIIDMTDVRDARVNMPVLSGDQIFIARKGNAFRDVIGPLASVLGLAAAIISVARQ